MGFWAIVGILIGIALGIGLALRMIVLSVKESNDMGDSRGNLRDFGTALNIMSSEDDLRKVPPYNDRPLLDAHCRTAESQYMRAANRF
ncbi:MAG: hypothetical protein IKR23_11425 [Lachnospiraceae bacterium]|nr:hypothetical protein [Lachnospiraceae bacterium]